MATIRVEGKNLYRAKPQGLALEGICGGRGRGEAHRLTPARPSTRAHHAIFPSWTTHSTDHVLSEGKWQQIPENPRGAALILQTQGRRVRSQHSRAARRPSDGGPDGLRG